jgi:lyso-ornithine lipid O-acyltransferase
VLCATLPLSPIAKLELQSWPGIGSMLEKSNVIFVRRKDPYGGAIALRRALRALQAGVSVLNFPEGTTTSGRLLPFHRGAFWLARRTGAPLVPVAIRLSDPTLCWVDDEAFVPHYARLWWRRDRRVKLVFAPALDPRAFADEHELSAAARQAIERAYAGAATPAGAGAR